MVMMLNQAQELIESVFSFDNVGDSMMALRKSPDNKELQQKLIKELIECAVKEAGDSSADTMAIIKQAAEARVQQYVAGSKSSQSGCGGLK
jgi:hypothetical protein